MFVVFSFLGRYLINLTAVILTHILKQKICTDYCLLTPKILRMVLKVTFIEFKQCLDSLITPHNVFFVEIQVQIFKQYGKN